MGSKKKIILVSAIFGSIVLILIGFGVYPLFNEIRNDSKEFFAIRGELILLQSKIENIEKMKKSYERWDKDLEKIDKLFVDSKAPIDLMEFWEKIAGDSNVLITVSPIALKSKEEDSWNSMGFQVNLTGSYPNFLRFFDKFEAVPYLIEIQKLAVRRLTEQDLGSEEYEWFSLGDVNANLSVEVFAK